MPPHDALLALHIHEQILLEMLRQCGRWGTKCVVVRSKRPMDHALGPRKSQRPPAPTALEIPLFPSHFAASGPLREARSPPSGTTSIGYPEVELAVENGR